MFQPLSFSAPKNELPEYFEEIVGRGTFIAVGSRAYTAATDIHCPKRYEVEEGFGPSFTRMECAVSADRKRRPAVYDGYASDEDSDSCLSSDESLDTEDEPEGYESWSEGSTDNEDIVDSDYADSNGEEENLFTDSSSEEESGEASEASSASQEDSTESDADASSVDDSYVPAEAIYGYQSDSDDEDHAWGHAMDARLGGSRRVASDRHSSSTPQEPEMLLTVFDISGGVPKKLFHYTHPLTIMIYASPPAIHPRAPLVAWALGAGDVLFADFVGKTFFTRKLRPSARYSK
jgi:hypothetical protein